MKKDIRKNLLDFFTKERTEKIGSIFLLIYILFFVISYIICAFGFHLDVDSSFYLSASELIFQGKIPYKDFALGYTPIGLYMLQIPQIFMGETPSYTGYLLFYYFLSITNGFLVGIIAKKITKKRILALLACAIYLLFTYLWQNIYLMLEPFAVFWGLLSLLIIIEKKINFWRCYIAGAFAALGFLSKQYGLGFFGVLFIYFLCFSGSGKDFIKYSMYAMGGFFSIIGCFLLFFIMKEIPFEKLSFITGGNYGNRTSSTYFEGLNTLIYQIIPLILFLPLLLYYYPGRYCNKYFLLALGGLIIFSFQFYFHLHPHYYIFLIPFVSIFCIIPLNEKKPPIVRTFFLYSLVLLLVINSIDAFNQTNRIRKREFKIRQYQLHQSQQINDILKSVNYNTVYCFEYTAIPYNFFNNFTPPLIEKYGYGFAYSPEIVKERLEVSDVFITGINYFNYLICSPDYSETYTALKDKYEFHEATVGHEFNETIYGTLYVFIKKDLLK